jgi:hypothetical protein
MATPKRTAGVAILKYDLGSPGGSVYDAVACRAERRVSGCPIRLTDNAAAKGYRGGNRGCGVRVAFLRRGET